MARYDILGIGNAITDMVAPVEHDFLSRHDMHPGTMALIDEATAERLTAALPEARRSGGGSAANTCVVAAGLGARVAYLGRVADDAEGAAFRADIAAAGVHCPLAPQRGGLPTARCIVLVSPDGQRTMNTFLGASVGFGEHDVDEALVGEADITYLEGYLFDPPAAQAAFRRAAAAAHRAGRRVALSLSDAFCVDRHREAFRGLLREVDVLFANEAEICSLFRVNAFADAVAATAGEVGLAALTCGAAGSVIVAGGERVIVAAEATTVVDTTGAGDAYAAGFLFGQARAMGLAESGRIGSVAAAEVISHYGARPAVDLRGLL